MKKNKEKIASKITDFFEFSNIQKKKKKTQKNILILIYLKKKTLIHH